MKKIIPILFFLFASCFSFAQSTEEFFSVPIAFTPNGDGKNDTLHLEVKGIKHFIMKVYDAGRVVATLNETKKNWNGKYFSDPSFNNERNNHLGIAGVSTCRWHAEIEYESGKKEIKSGNITLIR